jgi:drug/metabolite transporter (DMT)-like permease
MTVSDVRAHGHATARASVAPVALFVVLLWGGSYPAIRSVQAVVSPVPLATFRAVVGSLVLLATLAGLAVLARGNRAGRRDWPTLALAGFAGTTVFQVCMVSSLRYTTPAHAALMVNLNPVFASLLARLFLGEPVSAQRALGILVALAGATLIVARGDVLGPAVSVAGDLLAVVAGLGWAVYSILAKPLLAVRPALEVTTLAMLIGTLPLLPLGLPGLVAVSWRELPPVTWLLLGYLSVLTQALSYLLWYWALARAATARVVVFSYLTPVVAGVISIGLGQEPLTAMLVTGALLVIGGVVLAQLG